MAKEVALKEVERSITLALELGVPAKAVIDELKKIGIAYKSSQSFYNSLRWARAADVVPQSPAISGRRLAQQYRPIALFVHANIALLAPRMKKGAFAKTCRDIIRTHGKTLGVTPQSLLDRNQFQRIVREIRHWHSAFSDSERTERVSALAEEESRLKTEKSPATEYVDPFEKKPEKTSEFSVLAEKVAVHRQKPAPSASGVLAPIVTSVLDEACDSGRAGSHFVDFVHARFRDIANPTDAQKLELLKSNNPFLQRIEVEWDLVRERRPIKELSRAKKFYESILPLGGMITANHVAEAKAAAKIMKDFAEANSELINQ